MALAYLWTLFRLNRTHLNPYIRSFVIDHGLRPNSAEEAQLVASRIEPLLGKPSRVITLNWDKYGNPNDITAKETIARNLRFRALAEAARNCDLQCILLGHHADDSVETSICRIRTSSRASGLIGMKSVANIPECFGLYGINGSGAFNRLTSHSKLPQYVGGPESGGITIGRPLLEFAKSRLVATCKKAGIEWIEDKSNQDVTLTPRNAVRMMLKNNLLPMALRSENMLAMIKNINHKLQATRKIAQKFHEATYVKSLDLRSGVMEVYLPSIEFTSTLLKDYPNEQEVFLGFAEHFYSLAVSVYSGQVLRMRITIRTARILFEGLLKGYSKEKRNDLSFGKIMVQYLDSLVIDGKLYTGLRLCRSTFSVNRNPDRPASILLPPLTEIPGYWMTKNDPGIDTTLQPPLLTENTKQAKRLEESNKDDPLLRYPLIENVRNRTSQKGLGTDDTHLWDGRFWISIQNYSPVPLQLEALDQSKMAYFRLTMYGSQWDTYLKLFSEAAPGDARWTIPAIVCHEPPPRDSMVRPNRKLFLRSVRHEESAVDESPALEIFKYSGEPIRGKGDRCMNSRSPLPGKVGTIVNYSLGLDPFASGDTQSRGPKHRNNLLDNPPIRTGIVDTARYPMPSGPFIVAIPTMGMFLNHYWAQLLRYDIRYKKVDLNDMEYITSYRMEKPVMVDGLRKDAILPKVVGERIESESEIL